MSKSKLDEYAESIYRLTLVPDTEAGSDSVGAVEQTPKTGDMFTQAANRLISQFGAQEDANFDKAEKDDGGTEEAPVPETSETLAEEDEEVEITHGVDGIKIKSHGVELSLSNVIVTKILDMFNTGPSETEEEEAHEEHEASETPEHEAKEEEEEDTEEEKE